jgi:hypothetical protein
LRWRNALAPAISRKLRSRRLPVAEAQMRFGFAVAVASMGALAVAACSSSSKGSAAPDTSDASLCVDTTGGDGDVTVAIDDVFNKNMLIACPLSEGTNPVPLSYDMAIDTSCTTLGMTTGDVQFGQCNVGGYLVWEVDLDSTGHNFSKCYYSPVTHALVGVLYGDGKQDQCNGTSYTIQAGSVEPCTISGLSAQGAGGMFEDCKPIPEGGLGGG